jgi:hypothetical protein
MKHCGHKKSACNEVMSATAPVCDRFERPSPVAELAATANYRSDKYPHARKTLNSSAT